MDAAKRSAYVENITNRKQASPMIETFPTKIQEATGQTPKWPISGANGISNAGEYTSPVVSDMLSDMDMNHIPAIAYSFEENSIAEKFNLTIMNALPTALNIAGMN